MLRDGIRKIVKFKHSKTFLLSLVLLVMTMMSLIRLLWAATPDPGHPWSGVGDGNFAIAMPNSAYTYTFPDANATVLTTNALVTVAQGGTGTSSLTGVIIGNGTSPMTGMNAPLGGDWFVTTGSSHALTNKTINLSDNTLTATSMATGDLIQGFGYSTFARLARGSAGQTLRVAGSGAALEWASVGTPAGSDTQLQYNNSGSLGATSSLTWDQSNRALGLSGYLVLASSSVPTAPSTGTLSLYGDDLGGRILPAIRSDQDYSVIQPSIYQNSISLATFCNSTTFCSIGTVMGGFSSGSAGTESNVVSEAIFGGGSYTGTDSPSSRGYCENDYKYYRGSLSNARNGYFFFARIQSDTASVSVLRYYVGLTDQTGSTVVTTNDPSGSRSGFAFIPGDSNWMFENKAGGTVDRADTGIAVATSKVYDFYLYNPPMGGTVSWRIDNLTDGTSGMGAGSTSLPTSSVALKACLGSYKTSTNGQFNGMAIQKVYVEVPR